MTHGPYNIIFIKILPVEAVVLCARTHMAKLIIAFAIFANAPFEFLPEYLGTTTHIGYS